MRKVILILGRTGSGKTTLAKQIINDYSKIIIIDSLAEYQGLIFYSLQDFIDYLRNNDNNNFRYVLRFSSDLEIELTFKLVFEYFSDVMLVLEEAEIYINPYSKSSNFLRLVRYGRHKNISLICIARRFTEISNDFRAQLTAIYSFKQLLQKDIQYLKDNFEIDTEKLDKYNYVYKDFT